MALFNNLKSDTNEATKQALNSQNASLNTQQNLANQYTGNQGYQNSIGQGLTGAAVTANQAGAQAQKAARNAGMSKAQAAALGGQNAASAYGQNFTNQQGMAANMGNQAVGAQSGITSGYSNLAGNQIAAQKAQYNRAANNLGTVGQTIGNVGSSLTGLFGLSDERCKDIQDRADSLSKAIENIDLYKYEYTDEAKEAYPDEAKDGQKVGVMAQDLESNPITKSAVVEDEQGIKHVDTNQLALQAIGLIGDLSRRLSEVENGKKE